MHRFRFVYTSAILGILFVLSLSFWETPAQSRDWDQGDSLAVRVRLMADEGRYQELIDILPPLVDDARARGDSLQLGRLICARGRAELGVGNIKASERYLIDAARISEAHADTLTWLTSLGVRAFALNHQARFDETLVVLDRQIEIARAADDTLGMAFALLSTGYARLNLGQAAEARSAYMESEALFGAAGSIQYQLTALTGLGRAYSQLDDVDGARRTYRRVERLAREAGDAVNEADAINNLGVLEYHYGDLEQAASHFERAWHLKSTQAMYDGDALSNVALIRTTLGDYASAAAILEEARSEAQERGAVIAHTTATVELGNVYLAQGRSKAAARMYREAIHLGSPALEHGEARIGLARVLIRSDSLDAALAVARRSPEMEIESWAAASLTLIESRVLMRMGRLAQATAVARNAVTASDGSGLYASACAQLADCLATSGDTKSAQRWLEAAVAASEERRRATGSLNWREVTSESVHPVLIDVAATLLGSSGSPGELEAAFNLMQRLKARTLLDRIASPARAHAPVVSPSTLADVQRHLADGDLLLDFHTGDHHTLLFAVTSHESRLLMLPGQASSLAAQVELLRDALGQRSQVGSSAPWIAEASRAVGNALLDGIADMVPAVDRLVVSPDGYLNAVPFVLLSVRSEAPLGEHAQVVRLPVASMLARSASAGGGHGVIALTGTDGALTGAAAETRHIERHFRDVYITRGLVPALRDSLASRAVIHVAAHVDVDDTRPWYSGIRLVESNEDGATHLRASDILELELRGRLAVLAACESGMGKLSRGQGVLGLSSAFLVSGMESVLATLWRVDDRATSELMAAFYDGLARGATPTEALATARARLRSRPATQHPYYWAGFILVGMGEGGVELRERPQIGPLALIGLALVVLAGILLVIKNRRSA